MALARPTSDQQVLRLADAVDDAELRRGDGEDGRGRGEAEIVGEGEAAAAADAEALDRRDGRLRQMHDRIGAVVDDAIVGVARLAGVARRRELGDVGAGAEMLARAGEDDGADRVVGGEGLIELVQRMPHLELHGVAPLRPVDRHRRDIVGDRDDEVATAGIGCAHGMAFSRSAAGRARARRDRPG